MTTDDDRQRRLTRDALAVLANHGFALAGFGAIREHGISSRPTQDVDLFTGSLDTARFDTAVEELIGALSAAGYTVAVIRRASTFARLQVRTPDGGDLDVDLGVDWRSSAPTTTQLGPVLALEDAVGSKISALYSRAETRDFLDADSIRQSGRYSDTQLLGIMATRDPGFDTLTFAGQLDQVRQLSATEVRRYGVTADQLAGVQQRIQAGARALQAGTTGGEDA